MDSTRTDEENKDLKPFSLTARQLERIESNKQRALLLRKSRVANLVQADKAIYQKEVNTVSRPRDTGGGFLFEDADTDEINIEDRAVVHPPAPLPSIHRPNCEKCSQEFNDSFLQKHYGLFVCDSCRDVDGEHALISKTDAKMEYLLKDCDFEKREPHLKFILKKNPHNMHGNMKLYLRLQVEQRAFDVHGSEEKLEDMKEEREKAQEKRKQKAFDKKIKALRMSVRSSLYRKKENSHTHIYGPESYKEDDDIYEKICTICDHKLCYEKM